MENDYGIDLTELDSVRKNLNGFWLVDLGKQRSDEETILSLEFNKNNVSPWENISYKSSFFGNSIGFTSCQAVASLIKIKDSVQIEFVGLNSSDTTKIEFLSKTKLIIGGITYSNHKGYPELK